ncbi:unnamed protein product [Prorocentrum cordatum]|uniref:Uncharacterized protein n=1 Tax=Prorocentrum cordatum TaxID=2364126 RepID=A0ABN9RB11_9DINO|nr:unnamed protein product [Polarella glacialis]
MLRHAGLIRIQCTCCTAAGGDTGQGVALYEHGRGQKSQEETEQEEDERRRRRRRRRTRGGGLVPLWLWMPRALAPRVDRKNAGRRCAGAAAAADPSKPRRVRENTGRSRGRRRTPRESPATNDALPHTFAPRRGSSSRERGREDQEQEEEEQQQQEEKQGGPAREKTSRARCEAYNAALHRRYTFS